MSAAQAGIEFVKGHGTENDFVLLPDPGGALDLTPSRVRALCDRRRGLGADGVLRVVPGSLVPDAPAGTVSGDWFMDYRNADGTVAEMCGNGVRVFARYLAEAGLVAGTEFAIGSRSGPRAVTLLGGGVAVQMGTAGIGEQTTVTVEGEAFEALAVDVGNPHAVCVLDEPALDTLDLTVPPGHDPAAFPHGVNVEFVQIVGQDQLRMRVHERGVGETRSCGTGTVAVAAAVLHLGGLGTGELGIETLGGVVRVQITDGGSVLYGPAELVAAGQLDRRWWDTH